MKDFKGLKSELLAQIFRASDIVDSTLRLSKPKERSEAQLNLNDVIGEALKLYQPIGIALIKELSPLPLMMKGDFEDLKIVIINLVKNAREAIPTKEGKITVKTYVVDEEKGKRICAEVSDTGVGIPKENLEKIFEPFFSTHVTKGRGLGLSIVFRIMREHLGEIEVKSGEGQGATFTLKFPAI